MDLNELFGEGTLKTLALATAEDAKAHLAAGHPLRAALSAAHHVQISGARPWSDDNQAAMAAVLLEEVDSRLRSGDGTTAAWRAGYYLMLAGTAPWTDEYRERLIRAAYPREGLRPWKRVWFAAQAADYYLVGGQTFWDRSNLDQMLAGIHDDFVLRLRHGDRLMAADRVVLYIILASSLGDAPDA